MRWGRVGWRGEWWAEEGWAGKGAGRWVASRRPVSSRSGMRYGRGTKGNVSDRPSPRPPAGMNERRGTRRQGGKRLRQNDPRTQPLPRSFHRCSVPFTHLTPLSLGVNLLGHNGNSQDGRMKVLIWLCSARFSQSRFRVGSFRHFLVHLVWAARAGPSGGYGYRRMKLVQKTEKILI